MSRYEALHTRLGEMYDMLACHAIAHGADQASKAITSYDDAMKVR